jgi:hypothetical protein
MSRWMGPLAGLAAGIGLAALFSHLGMGEGMANMMMMLLLGRPSSSPCAGSSASASRPPRSRPCSTPHAAGMERRADFNAGFVRGLRRRR